MEEVAIFWDYENVRVVAKGINVPLAESLVDYSESVGHPRVKKVYSDWAGINKVIIQALYSLGFDTIQVSMGKTNSVDVKLAVDCLDTAQLYPEIKYFIIVTGDKDFIPVVNWLKSNRKEVIIISRTDIVSEHLLLSANKFVSLEQISKMYKAREFSKTVKLKEKTISFEEAIKCLIETIKDAREQGKSTRLALVDNFMRSSSSFEYSGASSVLKSDNSGTFSSLTKFINAVEKTKRIKTETIEGFKEIFLMDEDPQVESEFSPIMLEKINENHWKKIFEIIRAEFTEEKTLENEDLYGRFMNLLKVLRIQKKEGNLPFSNRTIKQALEKIIEIGFLIKQLDGSYRLVEDYDSNFEKYLEKVKQ